MGSEIKEAMVKKAPAPKKGNRITYDTKIKGFGLRVTAAGAKSFILNYHVGGRERRITIGAFPAWTATAARGEAAILKRRIDQGEDPLEKKRDDRTAPTVAELWAEYSLRRLPDLSPRSRGDVSAMWSKYILPHLGTAKITKLGPADVDSLHRKVSAVGKTRANRVVENFRTALNHALRLGWIDKNVADGFRRHPEQPREIFLTAQQLATALSALGRMRNKQAAEVIQLLMLTGCRLGEALKAEWNQFDLNLGVWTKPSSHTKQRRLHRTPLSPEAVLLLKSMQARAKAALVFPNKGGSGPITDINKPWAWLKTELKLPTLRIHDLRHTFASHLISSGEGLSVIGQLLGHTQHQTTMRYAHLFDEPMRRAASKIGGMMSNAKTQAD